MNGLNLGYALDVNTSGLIFKGATSHEVILTYSFNIAVVCDFISTA